MNAMASSVFILKVKSAATLFPPLSLITIFFTMRVPTLEMQALFDACVPSGHATVIATLAVLF